jgi:DNA repair ATPase RecN
MSNKVQLTESMNNLRDALRKFDEKLTYSGYDSIGDYANSLEQVVEDLRSIEDVHEDLSEIMQRVSECVDDVEVNAGEFVDAEPVTVKLRPTAIELSTMQYRLQSNVNLMPLLEDDPVTFWASVANSLVTKPIDQNLQLIQFVKENLSGE